MAAVLASLVAIADAATGGPEHQVNLVAVSEQGYPAVAPRGAGFVVVWESYNQDGSGKSVVGRRLDATGRPVGAEFQVSTWTTNAQDTAAVASDDAGNFVVVWESFDQDGSTDGIFGRRFSTGAVPLGDEFQVNATTINSQDDPQVAMSFSGAFVVTWEAFNQDGSAATVVFQRYSSSGVKLGGETIANTYTTGSQLDPDIAMDAVGRFVIVWTSALQDGSQTGIFGQRFNSAGVAQGTEFRANTFTTGTQDESAVASDFAGNFIVAWESNGQDGSGNGVYAQRYNSVGAALGSEFRVNSVTQYSQDDVAIAADAAGGFIVSWESLGQDGGQSNGVFHRTFDASGTAVTTDVQSNLTTAGNQDDVAIAIAGAGHYTTAWNSFGQDGDSGSIIDRRYGDGAVTTTTITTTTTTVTTSVSTTLPASLCASVPYTTCKLSAAGRSKIQLHERAGTKDDLNWKLSRAEATSVEEFLDPADNVDARYEFCVYDAGGVRQPLLAAGVPAASVCAGRRCWSRVAGGYKYKDKLAASDGVIRAKLKSGAAGKAGVALKAKGPNLVLPSLPLAFPVTVQLVADDGVNSACWQTLFAAPLVNRPNTLKAKGP